MVPDELLRVCEGKSEQMQWFTFSPPEVGISSTPPILFTSYVQYLKGWGKFVGPGKAHFLVHVRSLIPCRNRSDLNRHNGEWRLGFPGGGKRHSR